VEADRIAAYRAGYLPEERRRIERELFSGNLLGVIATTALELGIDIGDLGATVLTGYPGSIASTWQQAGRAGRGEERSLSFLIAQDNPLDQYLMRHPEAFFGKSVEHALIDPGNSHILAPHLLCAAYELPLGERDRGLFGNKFTSVAAELEETGLLRKRRGRWHLSPQINYPAETVSIRSASSERYALVNSGKGGELLETLDADSVFFSVYPGAIYLHQGESYLVEELDLGSRTAYMRMVNVPYYTQTKEVSEVRILEVAKARVVGSVKAYLGTVEVTTDVVGFKKKRQYTDEVIGEDPLDLPSQTIDTVALWFDIPPDVEARFLNHPLVLAGGLHALEHAAIGLLPLYALCDRNDIGGLSTPSHIDTGRPQIFIYDAHPGGIGISEKGFELLEDLWRTTLSLVTECPCEDGCPSCVHSPKCGNNNEPLDKQAAKVILEGLLGVAAEHQGR
jgi:DEAD/DEAH box helicase domain-containing protein